MTDEASLQLQSIPGPLPMGGEKHRRWRTEGQEGVGGVEGEGDMNERDGAKLRGVTTTKLLQHSDIADGLVSSSPRMAAESLHN